MIDKAGTVPGNEEGIFVTMTRSEFNAYVEMLRARELLRNARIEDTLGEPTECDEEALSTKLKNERENRAQERHNENSSKTWLGRSLNEKAVRNSSIHAERPVYASATAVEPSSVMDNIRQRLSERNTHARYIKERLTNLGDRIYGPISENGKPMSDQAEPRSPSATSRIHEEISDLADILDGLEIALQRIEDIA